eukprot:11283361-Alexandrium_andersonii.AAC.1
MCAHAEAEDLQALHLGRALSATFALALPDEVWQGAAIWKARTDQRVKGEWRHAATHSSAGQVSLRQ